MFMLMFIALACLPLLRPLFNFLIYGGADLALLRDRGHKATLFPWYRSKHRKGSVLNESGDQENFFRQSRTNGDNSTRTRIERIEGLSNIPEAELRDMDPGKGIRVHTEIQIGHGRPDDQV